MYSAFTATLSLCGKHKPESQPLFFPSLQTHLELYLYLQLHPWLIGQKLIPGIKGWMFLVSVHNWLLAFGVHSWSKIMWNAYSKTHHSEEKTQPVHIKHTHLTLAKWFHMTRANFMPRPDIISSYMGQGALWRGHGAILALKIKLVPPPTPTTSSCVQTLVFFFFVAVVFFSAVVALVGQGAPTHLSKLQTSLLCMLCLPISLWYAFFKQSTSLHAHQKAILMWLGQ